MKTHVALHFLSLSFFFFHPGAKASNDIEEFLTKFHRDTVETMSTRPYEVDRNGRMIPTGKINYELRSSTSLPPALPDTKEDDAKDLIEPGNVVTNIMLLAEPHLTAAKLPETPWTDSYWPIYKGLTGVRYNDPLFPDSKNWLDNYTYISFHTAPMVAFENPNMLSPAEKYDFIVGDSEWTLSTFAWDRGKKYFEESGVVETWMGICHGWSGAAHMLVEIPPRAVWVSAPNGRRVKFYQSDIKALNSMLWAYASPSARFVGRRCDRNPPRNAVGRILDPACFDTNPATWHVAVTNQVGIHKRSFVMDATFDTQVWNYAVVSYKYGYFNPQTLRTGTSVQQSMIPIGRFTIDKFREFRSPAARHVVGIYMDVDHLKATNPGTGSHTGEEPTKTVRYFYDLELDERYNIIGGEWYSNAHPDFLWTYDLNAQALAVGDRSIGTQESWITRNPVPERWTAIARQSSSKGQPLHAIIRALVNSSTDE